MDVTHPVVAGLLASGAASMGTALGAVLVFAIRELRAWTEDALLSGAAGIMLAASFYSLLQPGLALGADLYGGLIALAVVTAGFLAGGLMLWSIDRWAPHEHFHSGPEGPPAPQMARLWLFVIAITLHNFPEGMAVGVGAAGGDASASFALTLGIGVQNVPEGLAVATSLLAAGYRRGTAALVAFATGLVEPLGGLLGASLAWLAESLLPGILAFAAGAMVYIISDEIIPETHRPGHETIATASLMGGLVLMLAFDVLVG